MVLVVGIVSDGQTILNCAFAVFKYCLLSSSHFFKRFINYDL